MSLGFPVMSADVTLIDKAIQRAYDADIVLCAAVGNFGADVAYPACHDLVIGVGAIGEQDKRKEFNDGLAYWLENVGYRDWDSCYGEGIDVVAPGVFCFTTDITGPVGYNPSGLAVPTGYYKDFSGTSAACPHVSGLVALIRFLNPSLNNNQVRDIIELSCEKISGYSFQDNVLHPNGTWNREVGYGLVDGSSIINYLNNPPKGGFI